MQLLQRRSGSWVDCDIAMDQTATAMLDHYEHVRLPKRHGDGDEETGGLVPCKE
jgi:hypothetical protein